MEEGFGPVVAISILSIVHYNLFAFEYVSSCEENPDLTRLTVYVDVLIPVVVYEGYQPVKDCDLFALPILVIQVDAGITVEVYHFVDLAHRKLLGFLEWVIVVCEQPDVRDLLISAIGEETESFGMDSLQLG